MTLNEGLNISDIPYQLFSINKNASVSIAINKCLFTKIVQVLEKLFFSKANTKNAEVWTCGRYSERVQVVQESLILW